MFETILIFSVIHLIALFLIVLPFEDDLIRSAEFNFITVFFIINLVINPVTLTLVIIMAFYEWTNWEYKKILDKDKVKKAYEEDRKQYINNCRKLIK